MTIYTLYIFSRTGACLYYHEWHRPHSTLKDMPQEDRKLMFGLLFSLKQLMNKMNPNQFVRRFDVVFMFYQTNSGTRPLLQRRDECAASCYRT